MSVGDTITLEGYLPYLTYFYRYDACSRQIDAEADYDLDGVADTLTTYTWEELLLVSYQEDDGLDGTIDSLSEYTHDADGHVTRWTTDDGLDGVLEREVLRTWDGDLMTVEESVDEYIIHYGYVGDLEVSSAMDTDFDGITDLLITTSWLDDHRTAGEAATFTGQPDLDYDEVHSWDGDLKMEELTTFTLDGTQRVTEYEYNADGLVTLTRTHYLDPAWPLSQVEYIWDCP